MMEDTNTNKCVNTITSVGSGTSSNDDCYFYYYSSCTKGSQCPFRHEPASLCNETMCRYWILGNCSKPNCIFRHMQIRQPRDKIPCFFESQPSGCKKVHCSFFHNNVLDQPREEDLAKNHNIILPLSDSSQCQQRTKFPDLPRNRTNSPELLPTLSSLIRNHPSVIVNFDSDDDDDDDAAAAAAAAVAAVRADSSQRLRGEGAEEHSERVMERKLELLKLQEIQNEQAALIGYIFENDGDEQQQDASVNGQATPTRQSFIDEIEEIIEFAVEEECAPSPVMHTYDARGATAAVRRGGLAAFVIADALKTNARPAHGAYSAGRFDRTASRKVHSKSFNEQETPPNCQVIRRENNRSLDPTYNINRKSIRDRLSYSHEGNGRIVKKSISLREKAANANGLFKSENNSTISEFNSRRNSIFSDNTAHNMSIRQNRSFDDEYSRHSRLSDESYRAGDQTRLARVGSVSSGFKIKSLSEIRQEKANKSEGEVFPKRQRAPETYVSDRKRRRLDS